MKNPLRNNYTFADSRDILDYLSENNDTELQDLIDEISDNNPECEYGLTIIHESYFTEYMEQELNDIGYLPSDLPSFIYNHIDFNGIAEYIKNDYYSIEYCGNTYYYRAS